jgi:hypothetical protein
VNIRTGSFCFGAALLEWTVETTKSTTTPKTIRTGTGKLLKKDTVDDTKDEMSSGLISTVNRFLSILG